jgi:hypothetical protein
MVKFPKKLLSHSEGQGLHLKLLSHNIKATKQQLQQQKPFPLGGLSYLDDRSMS